MVDIRGKYSRFYNDKCAKEQWEWLEENHTLSISAFSLVLEEMGGNILVHNIESAYNYWVVFKV